MHSLFSYAGCCCFCSFFCLCLFNFFLAFWNSRARCFFQLFVRIILNLVHCKKRDKKISNWIYPLWKCSQCVRILWLFFVHRKNLEWNPPHIYYCFDSGIHNRLLVQTLNSWQLIYLSYTKYRTNIPYKVFKFLNALVCIWCGSMYEPCK